MKGFFLPINLKNKYMKKLISKLKSLFSKQILDKKLRYYHWEMNNLSNDGWTMSHYKKMYETRLKQINNK
jgi:hypothetical protein